MSTPMKDQVPIGWYVDSLGQHTRVAHNDVVYPRGSEAYVLFVSESGPYSGRYQVLGIARFIEDMRARHMRFVGANKPDTLRKDSVLSTGTHLNIII